MNRSRNRSTQHSAMLLMIAGAALLLATMARGETAPLPNAPSAARAGRVELALDAADVAARTLDLMSTHALLASPCRCFHEDDLLAPGTRSLPALAAFQYGMSAAAMAGGRELRRHGHGRLALLLVGADVVSESLAVAHNLRQRAPAPVGVVARLGVSR